MRSSLLLFHFATKKHMLTIFFHVGMTLAGCTFLVHLVTKNAHIAVIIQ